MSLEDRECRQNRLLHDPKDLSQRSPVLSRDSDKPRVSLVQPSSSLSSLPFLVSKPDTPSTRTGPPQSLSFTHGRRGSSMTPSYLNDLYESPSSNSREAGTKFRGPLEDPSTRDPKPETAHRAQEGQHNLLDIRAPITDFCDSSKQEPTIVRSLNPTRMETNSDHDAQEGINKVKSWHSRGHSDVQVPSDPEKHHVPETASFRHSASLLDNDLDFENKDKGPTMGRAKWARLRSFLPQIVHRKENILPGSSVVTSNSVNVIDELITGGLSTLMLKLWFELDEKSHRRIPVFLHRLRIRISDSLHPMHGHKSVFRIECEYANGVARWVVYRQLWDFWSLHTHYAVSNVYNRNVDKLPDFPTSIASLHYYRLLKKERGAKVSKADFARLQRERLEAYFIKLIRAVMFHPAANRLCTFLEISSIFISLAHSNGPQFKAGFLRVESSGSESPRFGRKSTRWFEEREKRWCVVSDGYLAAMEEPGELDVWDVFLLDSDFRIERPKRYYRRGFDQLFPRDQSSTQVSFPETSVTTWISKVFHNPLSLPGRGPEEEKNPRNNPNDDTELSPSSSAAYLGAPTPLLDPSTNTDPLQDDTDVRCGQIHERVLEGPEVEKQQATQAHERSKILSSKDVSKHTFYIVNSQMRLKLVAKNTRQMHQFITALEKAATTSPFTGSNRFGSFSPIRLLVSAQWLVDGRDYFWNLYRAIHLAKESIYIHDWWLSPEVLLRRPHKDKYRLDHLLERKAREGVKIYIILYQEVSNRTTPIDSNYAKQRLINLHDNIMVQRSPSHFPTGTFYWAHHEKLCVVDNVIAFMGGLDLCFGRWDTPQHVLTDDVADTNRPEIWPGKDYSNPRMSDFYCLDKPEENMYDRTKIPRMPWHDVGMQVIGQPARDLARHFVQRWNYLLRIKSHSKKMPFLLPPPEFRSGELEKLFLTGTCELQICRSAGPWSLGTPASVEHSIQTAYLRAIQESEHFVYIENQFFITSTVINDIKIENHIADTIVRRIIRAHRDRTPWKCCVLIPLLPGFTFPIDHSEASAVRIILECQNRTISRGPDSIFARLLKEGINPDNYIAFYSLRNWGKMRGGVLTTEQVYIHSKICIVDDRVVIIGSANINERSQRGDRDSELAAVIRDTDMIGSSMAGQPFKVGRFAHTLRVRLMQEHLGVNVDSLNEENLMTTLQPNECDHDEKAWDPYDQHTYGQGFGIIHVENSKPKRSLSNPVSESVGDANHVAHAEWTDTLQKAGSNTGDQQPTGGCVKCSQLELLDSEQQCLLPKRHETGILVSSPSHDTGSEIRHCQFDPSTTSPALDNQSDNRSATPGIQCRSDEEGSKATFQPRFGGRSPRTLSTKMPKIVPTDFYDPISDRFWDDIWNASAVHNTEIFRNVFHAIPDNHITTWKQYKEYITHHERLHKSGSDFGVPTAGVPSEILDESPVQSTRLPDAEVEPRTSGDQTSYSKTQNEEQLWRNTKHLEHFETWAREETERLLGEVNGHLVHYPTKFLEAEDDADNFLFNADRLLPLPIYV